MRQNTLASASVPRLPHRGRRPDRLPRAGSVLKRIPEEIGTRQISRTASGAEIDLLIATIPAFPNLPIQCDCHFASPNAKYCVGREMTFIRGKIPLKLVAGW